MWTYRQSDGLLTDPSGKELINGYAGHGVGLNNPEMQDVIGIGPLPVGFYMISPPENDPKLGPYAMRLTPERRNVMFGRAGFFIHGDRKDALTNPHMASDGCIILPLSYRQLIYSSKDTFLQVV